MRHLLPWILFGLLFGACLASFAIPAMKPPRPLPVEAPAAVRVAVEEDLYYESFRVQDNRLLAVVVDRKTGTRTLLVAVYQGVALSPLPKVAPGH